MEILSFLRLTGRRVVGLSVVAGLAGSGAGYAVTRSPATYEASATVFVGQALPAGNSSFDLPALVADFQAALALAPVIANTADAADVGPDEFTVAAQRNGDGSTVRVIATAPTAATAETVASTISLEAMKFVTTRQVDRAASLEAQRHDEADLARTAVSELDAENGFVDPVAQYAAVQAQATQLQLEAENPGSGLADAQRAGQLEQARNLRESLPQLALKAQQYQTASKTVLDAEASVSTATRDRVAAEAIRASATSPDAITREDAAAVSPLTAIMRAAGAAVLVTGAAGVGSFALLEERRRRRAERVVPAPSSGEPAPGAELGASAVERSSEADTDREGIDAGSSEATADRIGQQDVVSVAGEEAAEVYDYEADAKANAGAGGAEGPARTGEAAPDAGPGARTGRAALSGAGNGRD
ncbi:MAG: hypothetical protein GEV08_09270 [Acidimicrobiia bacterium]|nr:hypothetical protein [Acidimicrobiia bacterium]